MTEVDLRFHIMEMEQLVNSINSIVKEIDQLAASINNLSQRADKLTRCLYDILFPQDDSKIFFSYYPPIFIGVIR
jgi:prefoldin subunit 5